MLACGNSFGFLRLRSSDSEPLIIARGRLVAGERTTCAVATAMAAAASSKLVEFDSQH